MLHLKLLMGRNIGSRPTLAIGNSRVQGCVLLLSWFFLVGVGCKGPAKTVTAVDFVKSLPPETAEKRKKQERPKSVAINPLGWSYAGEDGPQAWGNSQLDHTLCKTGKEQSPLNLVYREPTGQKKPMDLSYQRGQVSLFDPGYALRLNFSPQSQLRFADQDYILEKAEIRIPSEHTLSGKTLPGEMQLYHRSTNGLRRAMVSLFFIEGQESPAFRPLLELANNLKGAQPSEPLPFDPSVLIPPQKTYYHYRGSLTHPPCHEGVQWFVMNTPIQMSSEQFSVLQRFYTGNRRPLQPLKGRSVTNY